MLQQFGYPPIIIKHGPENNYKIALQEWQVYGNSEMFLNLVKDCLMKELKEYIKIIEITRETLKNLNKKYHLYTKGAKALFFLYFSSSLIFIM